MGLGLLTVRVRVGGKVQASVGDGDRNQVGVRAWGKALARDQAGGREKILLQSVGEVLGERGFQGSEVGLVTAQEAEVQLPRGRVPGLAVKDCSPAVFPQENEAVSDFGHSFMEKLQEVLLVLRAGRRKRGYPK